MKSEERPEPDPAGAQFPATRWTVVLAHGDPEARNHLCAIYWPPIVAFLCRLGHTQSDARDLTQGFFARLLAGERLANVDPTKGKFRSFLLACITNYERNEREKQRALKRGGMVEVVPLLVDPGETQSAPEPATPIDPALVFERQWATTIIHRALKRLEDAYGRRGKPMEFRLLHPFLTGDSERGDYAEAAEQLAISEGAVRVRATRLRQDFGRLLYDEVAATVEHPDDPSEVRDEVSYLIRLFQSH